MFTGKQLAAYCEEIYRNKDHWCYWYGTYGKKCTKSLYESKKKQYPSHYGSDRTSGYMKDIEAGRRCADCVGMIKSFFWTGGKYDTDPKYATNHCPDVSANGMIALCKEQGAIRNMPDVPGLVVWKSGHIGVYVGNGHTVEMRGFAYDCVRRKLKDGPWVKWGKLPMLDYSDNSAPSVDATPQGLHRGDYGSAVYAMQTALLNWRSDCLPMYGADGEFGGETENAVKAFQEARGLKPTGVYDEATRAALTGVDAPQGLRDVIITGNTVNVRSAPKLDAMVLGVVKRGDRLPYQEQTREDEGRVWYLVIYRNENAWVSSKYARFEE